MKFTTTPGASLVALSVLSTLARAEDVLYSKRMLKRGLDQDGNYNICKLYWIVYAIHTLT